MHFRLASNAHKKEPYLATYKVTYLVKKTGQIVFVLTIIITIFYLLTRSISSASKSVKSKIKQHYSILKITLKFVEMHRGIHLFANLITNTHYLPIFCRGKGMQVWTLGHFWAYHGFSKTGHLHDNSQFSSQQVC